MKKFEYKQLYFNVNDNLDTVKHLNIFGNDGWELISVVDGYELAGKNYKHFFFKRPLKISKNENS